MKLILLGLFFSVTPLMAEPPTSRFDPEIQKTLENGLVLHLKLEKGLTDSSSKNHGTKIIGDVKIEEGEGAIFDGDGDCIELAAFDMADKSFAVLMWIKVTGEFGPHGVFQQKSAGKKREWLHFVLRNPMNPYLGFYMQDTWSDSMIRKIDGWRHVVVQYRRDKGIAEIWLDGVLDATKRRESFLGKSGTFQIGKAPSWGNVPMSDFQGILRDFRIYDRSLTEFEIGALALMR